MIICGFLLFFATKKQLSEVYLNLGMLSFIIFLVTNRTIMIIIFSVFGRFSPPSNFNSYAEERDRKQKDKDILTTLRWLITSVILYSLGISFEHFLGL
jgi:hypothetical protein